MKSALVRFELVNTWGDGLAALDVRHLKGLQKHLYHYQNQCIASFTYCSWMLVLSPINFRAFVQRAMSASVFFVFTWTQRFFVFAAHWPCYACIGRADCSTALFESARLPLESPSEQHCPILCSMPVLDLVS